MYRKLIGITILGLYFLVLAVAITNGPLISYQSLLLGFFGLVVITSLISSFAKSIKLLDTANEKRIEIESPFKLLREDFYDAGQVKFDISGVQGDLRASINPTLQLLDFMRDKRYGKGLDRDKDIDLASFIASAKLCEDRGTVTYGVATTDNIAVGDYYKLTDGNGSSGNHLGSARIKSVDTTAKTVTISNAKYRKTHRCINILSRFPGISRSSVFVTVR